MMVANGVMAVLVCLFATVGLCGCIYWLVKSITRKEDGGLVKESQLDKVKAISRTKKDDGGLAKTGMLRLPNEAEEKHEVEILDRLHTSLRPLLDKLGIPDDIPLPIGLPPGLISFSIRDAIERALETGIAYKRKYEALQKSEDLELRKYCIEQFEDLHTDQRIECGRKLYEYLKTGNLPEKEKEEKE